MLLKSHVSQGTRGACLLLSSMAWKALTCIHQREVSRPLGEMRLEVSHGQTSFSLCTHSPSRPALDALRPGLPLMERVRAGRAEVS